MKLADYVLSVARRGDCTCGKCVDSKENPKQPNGHSVNLTFFNVALRGGDAVTFKQLVSVEFPHWLDGEEHSFIEIGADSGDQGVALMTIGTGHLLGVWNALSPDTMMPSLEDGIKKEMAGAGMVTLKCG